MQDENPRRLEGDETWFRLKEWTKGQKAAERLASHILNSEGFESIDPSHPLGGRDGTKDFICFKNNEKWIGAVYFPRGQKTYKVIKEKCIEDIRGISKNGAFGLAFITNQEITVSQREDLMTSTSYEIKIYHLERLVNILNNRLNYGVRREFLGISLTTDEKFAYLADSNIEVNGIIDQGHNYSKKMFIIKDLIDNLQEIWEEIDDPVSLYDDDLAWLTVVAHKSYLCNVKNVVLNEISDDIALHLYDHLQIISSINKMQSDIEEAKKYGHKHLRSKKQLQDHYSQVIQKALFNIISDLDKYEDHITKGA
ncbi:hypothetical protein [Paenibacillus sp. 203]|uniref:hypothetical protein n=1 Tax=Paenibacillus sp. 203 TaxID=3096765 RepID=UPI00300B0C86